MQLETVQHWRDVFNIPRSFAHAHTHIQVSSVLCQDIQSFIPVSFGFGVSLVDGFFMEPKFLVRLQFLQVFLSLKQFFLQECIMTTLGTSVTHQLALVTRHYLVDAFLTGY